MTIVFGTPITATSLTDGTLTPSAVEGTISVVEKTIGDYALQCTLPAGATYLAKAQALHSIAPSKLTNAYFAASFRFTAPPQTSSGESHRITLLNIYGASGLRLFANRDGTYQWYLMCVNRHVDLSVVVEEFVLPFTPRLLDGKTHLLMLHWLRSSTVGLVEAWFDGVLIGQVAGLNTADVPGYEPYYNGGVTTFVAGIAAPNSLFGSPIIQAIVDDIIIADTPPAIMIATHITVRTSPVGPLLEGTTFYVQGNIWDPVNTVIYPGVTAPGKMTITVLSGTTPVAQVTKVTVYNGYYSTPFTGLPVGTYTIQADYSGDSAYTPSSITMSLTVNAVVVTRIVTFSSSPIAVTAIIGGVSVPNGGNIQVDDGSTINVEVPIEVIT